MMAAISLLRLCSVITPSKAAITKFIKRHPCLAHLVVLSEGVDFSLLSAKVEDLLTRDDVGGWFDEVIQAPSSDDPPDLPPPSRESVPSNISLLDEIKLGLPSDRTRLTGIRRTLRENPTEDPQEMGDIIVEFWDEVWKKRRRSPTASALADHLRSFTKRMNDALRPEIPSVEAIVTLINGSNNSSPGPDGIPFSFYRMMADPVAVCLLDIIKRLATGEKPPTGFNHARLFLIPKNNSFLVINTRPISVTNAENRLIAKMVNDLMMPAAAAFLHPAQKGFVPGRQGVDNVVDFTQAYYSSLSAKQQRYVLLLDTKKAFDSLDHDFIRAVLTLIGLPIWIVQLIDGLLDQVRVTLVLSCNTDHHIDIERGVKQGCPLSPLIFILCYDVLLESLASSVANIRLGGFADDLAVESENLSAITEAIKIIQAFALFSGLGLNMSKTVILTTLPTEPRDELQLQLAGVGRGSAQGRIHFVARGVYLGVLIGRDVGTMDVYEKAHQKFLSRTALFKPVLHRSSLHKRAVIFNVFLLTIYSYLAQLYEIPRSMVDQVREIVRKHVINFNGGGCGYAHLVNPRANFGPFTPVRDILGSNIAALAHDQDLLSSHGLPTPNPEVYGLVYDPSSIEKTMSIGMHKWFAAFRLLHDLNNRAPGGNIVSSHLHGTAAKVRSLIYRDFIDRYYWRHRDSPLKTFNSSLTNKLSRLVPGHDGVQLGGHIRAHAKLASKHMTPALWNNQFKLILDALPTDTRRVRGNMVVQGRPSPHTTSNFPCFLCGGFADDIRHLFQDECVPTMWARQSLRGTLGIDLGGGLLTALLAEPPGIDLSTLTIIALNFAIWQERSFLKGFAEPPDPKYVAQRLFERALELIPRPRGKTTSKAIMDFLARTHDDTFVIFTDGSSIPNPGPCGSGVYIILPRCLGGGTLDASVELGLGSNNIGEMHAILLAVSLVAPLLGIHPNCKMAIFTDSNLCEGFFMEGWAFGEDPALAQQTKIILRPFLDCKRATLNWVKAHDNLEGNERADYNAKRGAKGSAKSIAEARSFAKLPLYLNFSDIADTAIIDSMEYGVRDNYRVNLTRSTTYVL
jgi:ribonuclease HI